MHETTLKALIINMFILTMNPITMFVKDGVTLDKPAENYCQTLQFSFSLRLKGLTSFCSLFCPHCFLPLLSSASVPDVAAQRET